MNGLTVDVEEYYHANGLNLPINTWNRFESRVVESTQRLLECFDRYQLKATFFIVGCVARDHPELVKEIVSLGHEIGSHSGWHRLLTEINEIEFREDVRTVKQLLEDISGQEVYQYRAPSWSLVNSRYGWLRLLADEGYRIDSSIQPCQTKLGGVRNAPSRPFYPIIEGEKLPIIEFPATVWSWGPLRVPCGGGFYLRFFPWVMTAWLLSKINQSRPGMMYIHPWEMDPEQPRIDAAFLYRFAQYNQLHRTERKLNEILSRFSFLPLGQLTEELEDNLQIPVIQIQ